MVLKKLPPHRFMFFPLGRPAQKTREGVQIMTYDDFFFELAQYFFTALPAHLATFGRRQFQKSLDGLNEMARVLGAAQQPVHTMFDDLAAANRIGGDDGFGHGRSFEQNARNPLSKKGR